MSKNEVRLQYSGFIIFAAKIVSIATGMAFTIFLTRQEISGITDSEFGIWSNVFDLIPYFMLLASAISFWTTRFVARGKEGAAKTAVFLNLIVAIISVALYIPLAPIIISAINISEAYIAIYLIASVQIINIYLLSATEAYLRAEKPQAVGYGLLIEEGFKVLLAYTLVVVFQLKLLGAITSLVTATFIQVVYYLKLTSCDLKQKIQWNYVKEWLKGSTTYIYYLAGNQLAAFIFVMLIDYGGQPAKGNYQVAFTIANVITYSFFISFVLYPKLLAENSLKDVTVSLKTVLMFAIPMTAGALAIPDSLLTILGEPYKAATPILLLLAIDGFIVTISQFYTFVLFGVEKFDLEAKIPLKQLVRSDTFKVFTLPYIHSAITLPTTFYVLTNFATNQPVQSAVYVAAINMTARFSMFLILYVIMRKSAAIAVPWRGISKYVFAAAIMGAILYILPHPTRIILTLVVVAIGGIVYLSLLMVMDKDARVLVAAIFQEIKNWLKAIV